MRMFSLLFVLIALVVLVEFVIYVARGPVDPVFAGVLFFSFLVCAAPAVYLLKPFEARTELKRRRETRRRRRKEKDKDGG